MNRPEVINAAKLAILAAAAKNPAITPEGLTDEMQRGEISVWLHVPAIQRCTFAEWTAAMTAAAEELGQRQPTATSEAISNADAHLGNVGLPTYTELLAALRLIRERAGGVSYRMGSDVAARADSALARHDARMAVDAARR